MKNNNLHEYPGFLLTRILGFNIFSILSSFLSVVNIFQRLLSVPTEQPLYVLTPFLLGHLVTVQYLLICICQHLTQSISRLVGLVLHVLVRVRSELGLQRLSQVSEGCKAKGIDLVGTGDDVASTNVVAWLHEFRTSLDGSIGHIQVEAAACWSHWVA